MFEGISTIMWGFVSFFWPFVLFFFLAPLTAQIWLYWRQEIFKRLEQVLFEIRMPREVMQTPQSMEQTLAAIHALRNAPGDIEEKWVDGEIARTFSLEVVSFGGEIHWYFRCYWKSAPLVKAAFFSYYPDLELIPQDADYTERFPEDIREMNAQGYEMYSTEVLLAREAAFPIRTYEDFDSPDEDKQMDPVAALVEFLGQTQRDQIIAIQFVLVPAVAKWHEEFKELVQKLKESETGPKAKGSVSRSWDFSAGPLPVISTSAKEEEKNMFSAFLRTPGETDTLKAVEENLSRPAFEVTLRFLYFSPKPTYYDSFAKRGVVGSLNQYASQGLNSFRPNVKMITLTKSVVKPYIFPKIRSMLKKERALHSYKNREQAPHGWLERLFSSHPLNWNFYSRHFLLTTRCLATILHPPMKNVTTAPHMKRADSRKAGPPAGLAIFGTEEDVERYL